MIATVLQIKYVIRHSFAQPMLFLRKLNNAP